MTKTNLVERLRKPIGCALISGTNFNKGDPLHDPVRLEAADEIERLKAQLFEAQQAVLREGMERDNWCAQAQRFRKLYAELRYPGMTGIIKPASASEPGEHGVP
jgi:hypothetical protein